MTESMGAATMGMSTLTFLLIELGSMSMWMTLAWGAKASSRPVTRSSKRAPTATSRSLLATDMLAA